MSHLELFNDDCIVILKSLESNSVDSLVTDPPAGISFMGKEWDDDKGGRLAWIAWMTEVMTECLRVIKPGAHGLVWALPRVSGWTHRALEDAGFEVRDCITHLQGQGFPKSRNLEKETDGIAKGQGTALKPAVEFWYLVRKPISEKTVAANVLKWGCGGLNIEGCRIDGKPRTTHKDGNFRTDNGNAYHGSNPLPLGQYTSAEGRFPANLILDEQAAQALDEQSGTLKSGQLNAGHVQGTGKNTFNAKAKGIIQRDYGGDSGGASRFFYVAKASKSDKGTDNTHPTVKSTKLMEYLIKLITPPNGVVLDPFMGSGTTGVAALGLQKGFIGIEQSPEYFEISCGRIANSIDDVA